MSDHKSCRSQLNFQLTNVVIAKFCELSLADYNSHKVRKSSPLKTEPAHFSTIRKSSHLTSHEGLRDTNYQATMINQRVKKSTGGFDPLIFPTTHAQGSPPVLTMPDTRGGGFQGRHIGSYFTHPLTQRTDAPNLRRMYKN